jgi:hypothetical protein
LARTRHDLPAARRLLARHPHWRDVAKLVKRLDGV